jgi:glucose uptake protein GlcU
MEGVFTFLYQALHAQGEIGLAVSLGLRITSIVPSLLGGIAFIKKRDS